MLILLMWAILEGVINQAGAHVRNTDAQTVRRGAGRGCRSSRFVRLPASSLVGRGRARLWFHSSWRGASLRHLTSHPEGDEPEAEQDEYRLEYVRLGAVGDAMEPKEPVVDHDVEAEEDPHRDQESAEERARIQPAHDGEIHDQDRGAENDHEDSSRTRVRLEAA